MSNITNLTAQQLRHAADLKERIAGLQKQLGQLLGGTNSAAPSAAAPKRKMSASAIAKIRAAQKKRWAKVRAQAAGAKPAAAKPAKKTSGKMSAAAKAKLSARMKAIWAARKAAKK